MAEEMFDGFDHTRHREEVEERWGKDAYASGDRWWRSLSDEGKRAHQQQHQGIAADYGAASANGLDVASDEVQTIAQRQFEWLTQAAGTVSKGYFVGLGDMYVADPRFGANYTRGGVPYAEFVRDAMRVYAEREL